VIALEFQTGKQIGSGNGPCRRISFMKRRNARADDARVFNLEMLT